MYNIHDSTVYLFCFCFFIILANKVACLLGHRPYRPQPCPPAQTISIDILNSVQQRGPLTTVKTKNWSKEFKENLLAWFPTSRISHINRDLLKPNYGHWSLEDRRTRADLIEVYKIIHGLSAVMFSTFFWTQSQRKNKRTLSEVT